MVSHRLASASKRHREESMQTSIVLLRGINVGGKNKLPMKDLVVILEDLSLIHI